MPSQVTGLFAGGQEHGTVTCGPAPNGDFRVPVAWLRAELESSIEHFLRLHLTSEPAPTIADPPPFPPPPPPAGIGQEARSSVCSSSHEGAGAASHCSMTSGASAAGGGAFEMTCAGSAPEHPPAHDCSARNARHAPPPTRFADDCTTVMIRHIPLQLTQRQLVRDISALGFAKHFDFVYIPLDSRRRANRGIAFVNFVSPFVARRFAEIAVGRLLGGSEQTVEIVPADVQGFGANVERHAEALRNPSELSKPLVMRKLPPHLRAATPAATPIAAGRAVPGASLQRTPGGRRHEVPSAARGGQSAMAAYPTRGLACRTYPTRWS